MADITLQNRSSLSFTDVGAIICRTPITLKDTVDEISGNTIDNRCVLCTDVDALLSYFGDPFINPSEYADLIVAYRLVNSGIPLYISSLYDVKDNYDEFDVKYNGYTEFMFVDSEGYETVGYKLKSFIKFCQPVIYSEYDSATNKLDLYVVLYVLDRENLYSNNIDKKKETALFDTSRKYITLSFTFNTLIAKDSDIIKLFGRNGLELQTVNCFKNNDLIKEFSKYSRVTVSNIISDKPVKISAYGKNNETNEDNEDDKSYKYNYIDDDFTVYQKNYWYNIHSNDYRYDINDCDKVVSVYEDAVNRLTTKPIEPTLLCISKLYKSYETLDDKGNIIRSGVKDLDPEYYPIIQNNILDTFTDEGNTYIFMNTPDLSVYTVKDLLSGEGVLVDAYLLRDQYNCDLYHGYTYDFYNSTSYSMSSKVYFSTSSLAFFNSLYNNTLYMTNALSDINISNKSVKLIVDEDIAEEFVNLRCNSIVTFDKGYPSIYGDRSLSSSSNLQYSHVARYVVHIRRNIKNYLETKKFVINNVYNVNICKHYIEYRVLEQVKDKDVLSNYEVTYEVGRQIVYFYIELWFNGVANSIALNFTI